MVISRLTNGFGNNLSQCVAGKILSEHHGVPHYFFPESEEYQCTKFLEELGFKKFKGKEIKNSVFVNENDYSFAFKNDYKDFNIILSGYFEDYRYFKPNRDFIKNWFPDVENKNKNDLVFHFRTGDRLFYKNEFNSKPSPDKIKKAIDSFKFDRLYIVTDMYDWKRHTPDSLSNLKFHIKVDASKSVCNKTAVDYFNNCFDMLSDYKPIVRNKNVLEDFNFIRSFDKILFQHGTMSWWAAFLSNASKVGVYGPWRPWKGTSNKNLSNIYLPGWFKWE